MKNVFKISDGRWRFEIVQNGKIFIKTFKTKNEAIDYAKNYKDAKKFQLRTFFEMSETQIKDIKDALNLLPKNETLTEIVKKHIALNKPIALAEFVADFIEIKKAKHESGNLSKLEFSQIKTRLNKLKDTFATFEDITPDTILPFLKERGKNKTVSNWRGTINEFFNYCVRKDAMKQNPISVILKDEFLNGETPHEIEILTVEKTKEFLTLLETKYPQFAKFYALAMFAGIRVEEIPRMKDEYFRYEDKKIIFPAQIGKVKKPWVLEDLPDNLWTWLEKYKDQPIKRPSNFVRAKTFKPLNLPHNFARHSFATYHLSLYFDFAKTSKITRNSEQTLKKHYLAKLVDKATAQKYFEILPRQVAISSAKSEMQGAIIIEDGI